jgi:hypothetical protein
MIWVPMCGSSQDVVLVAPLSDAPGPPSTASTIAGMARLLARRLPPAPPGHLRVILRRPLQSCDTVQDLSFKPGLPQHLVSSTSEGNR